MAALPLTGISTSMVAQAIGEASNDVGTLFLSSKVNAWGFNPPGAANLNAVWGKSVEERTKLSPTAVGFTPIPNVVPGYHLGYFRGYDHDWVVYMNGGLNIETDEYYDPFIFRLYIEKIPPLINKPDPATPIDHLFKIEFARSVAAFGNGTATVIYDSIACNYPYLQFSFNASAPPDFTTNGQLDKNEVFYIKVTHLSSPARRWQELGEPVSIVEFTTPDSAFTDTYSARNRVVTAVDRLANPPLSAVAIFEIGFDLYADFGRDGSVDFKLMMSTTSDFSANVFATDNELFSVAKNTTPGTQTFSQHVVLSLSDSGIAGYTAAGRTLYWRLYTNGNELLYSGSVIVSDQPPVN
jgi:hypothetical protein